MASVGQWFLLGILIVGIGFLTVGRAAYFAAHRTDLTVFTAAANALLHGQDPYLVTNPRGWHFTSLPLAAVLFVPLALLPTAVASAVWYGLNLLFLMGTLGINARYLGLSRDFRRGWLPWLIPLFLLSRAILNTLLRGQWFIFIGFLIALSWMFLAQRRDVMAGLSLALAASVKLIPAIFGVYLVWKGRWKAVGGFILGSLVGLWLLPGCFVGQGQVPDLLHEWVSLVIRPALGGQPGKVFDQLHDPFIAKNQTISAVIHRAYLRTRSALTDRARVRRAQQLLQLIDAVVVGISGLVFLRSRNRLEVTVLAAEMGVVASLMLFLSPVAWDHYYVVLLSPLMLIESALWQNGSPLSRAEAVRTLVVFGVLSLLDLIVKVVRFYGGLLVTGLFLWGVLLQWLWRESSSTALSPASP